MMSDCLNEQDALTNNFLSDPLNNSNQFHSLDTNNQSYKQNSDAQNFRFQKSTLYNNILQKIQSITHYFHDTKFKYFNIYSLIFFSFLFFTIFIIKKQIDKRKIMVYVDSRYQIEIMKYNLLYNINSDSSMNVTENITINYQGTLNTGFRRLIPVDNGVQIRKIRIGQIVKDGIEKVYHKIYMQEGNIVLDIGDYQNKYRKNESYMITYEFRILNKKVENENMMPLDVIGYDWRCKINNAQVEINVPSGFTKALCFSGFYHKPIANDKFNLTEKRKISANFKFLRELEGVTFYLYFTPNSVRSYVDDYCAYYIKITFAVLAIIILLGLIVSMKNKVTPVRYTFAFNTMDPLVMSKVLNGSVRKRDVASIIFYWASEGYLDINLDNEDDPILIKNVEKIPDSVPSYQKYMFNELFNKGKVVKTSDLKYKFYRKIDDVIRMVNSQSKRYADTKSIVFSVLFAIIGGIWSFLAPFNLKKEISPEFDLNSPFIILIFQLIIWTIRYFMVYKYIYDDFYIILWIAVVIVGGIACSTYSSEIPEFMISSTYKNILCFSSLLCIITSVSLILKTSYFKAKINEIFGLKEFILHPVNEEFESFLKKDPELFYNLISYAQVLELTDKWKHKFDDLTATPPQWIKRSDYNCYYYHDLNMMHHRMNCVRSRMTNNLVDSPPRENSGGGGSSHSSGYHGGGGFGGGGGHGR